MGRMQEDGTWKDACLEKLKPGEPFFVLRAQDALAPYYVRQWLDDAARHGLPAHKITETIQTAEAMEQWPGHKKYPD